VELCTAADRSVPSGRRERSQGFRIPLHSFKPLNPNVQVDMYQVTGKVVKPLAPSDLGQGWYLLEGSCFVMLPACGTGSAPPAACSSSSSEDKSLFMIGDAFLPRTSEAPSCTFNLTSRSLKPLSVASSPPRCQPLIARSSLASLMPCSREILGHG
jgi:hypothetical protein